MPPNGRRTRLRLAIAGLLAALVLWTGTEAGRALIVRRDVGVPDAIVILASHEWERLPAAAALARRYTASQVLLTLPRTIGPYNCFRCLERPEWLVEEGVPRTRVVQLPFPTTNTHDEASAVQRYLQSHPIRRLLVVTSPYHTRRALATFEAALAGTGTAVGVEPAPSGIVPATWWWHGYDRGYVAYEWAAILYYRLRFRVPLATGS